MAAHLKSLGIKQQIQTIALGKKKAMYNELLPDQTVDVLAVSKNRRVEVIIKEISTSKTKPQKR
jgi:outer membrane protein OmpA-like peptidoglycan-associated protein